MTGRPVVVVAADARLTDTTRQLEHLLRLLVDAGHAPQVALTGDGERLRPLRALAPVVVVDRWRSRGLGRLPDVVGRRDLAQRYKGYRTRRWAERAAAHPWIVLDPRAASFLRHAPHRPPTVVAGLLGPTDRLGDVAPVDLDAIGDPDLWLAGTRHQADDLLADGRGEVIVTGDLASSRDLPRLVAFADVPPAVVLSAPTPAWSEPAHTLELVALLRRRRPELPLVWLVDRGDDRWLAHHDLDRLGPAATGVTVAVRGEDRIARPLLVVRTGYGASDGDLVLAAALVGVPTIGFELGDLPETAEEPIAPFDVEALAARVEELLDPEVREPLGDRLRAALDARHRLGSLFDLLER